jgi:hypothetical protein
MQLMQRWQLLQNHPTTLPVLTLRCPACLYLNSLAASVRAALCCRPQDSLNSRQLLVQEVIRMMQMTALLVMTHAQHAC